MSDSGGVNVSKTGLIIGLALALCVCIGWIGWGLSQSAEYERQSDNKRSEYSEYTRKKIAETCVGIPKAEAVKCRYEAFDARREYSYNQSDLEAQRKSALWAYIMGAAAVIGVALSAFGVWLVKGTFDETRRTNNVIAADAANSAAHLSATRDATVLAERAFLSLVFCRLYPPPLDTPDGFMVNFTLNNTGRSPARIVRVDYHIAETAYFAKKMRRNKRMNILSANNNIAHTPKFKLRRPRQDGMFFTGSVTYATIYNAEFQTYFCYKLPLSLPKDDGYTSRDHLDLTFVSHPNMPADT